METHPGSEPGGTGEERLERLIEVGRALVSELDLEAVLERVLDAAQELTARSTRRWGCSTRAAPSSNGS